MLVLPASYCGQKGIARPAFGIGEEQHHRLAGSEQEVEGQRLAMKALEAEGGGLHANEQPLCQMGLTVQGRSHRAATGREVHLQRLQAHEQASVLP
jgi:hypothetical protein